MSQSFATSGHEQAQAEALRRARLRATGLLAVVAAGFLATFALPGTIATGYLRAMLEAGLVGGLADWFAVVALFRHPLGVPIPHTAVIPRSKDGLGSNMAIFVRDNFLGEERVRERLADPAHVERLGTWLSRPANADRVARHLATLASTVFDAVDDDQAVDRITGLVRRRLGDLPLARLAGESLEAAITTRRHDALVTATVDGLRDIVRRNRTTLRRRLGEQSPSWVPEVVDDLVYERAEQVVSAFLRQLAEDRRHELRQALDEQLIGITRRMRADPETAKRVEQGVLDALSEDTVRRWVAGWWRDVREALAAAAEPDADAALLRRVAREALTELGGRLCDDPVVRARVVEALGVAAPQVAEAGQQEIGALIAATIERWDADETARRLELWMGPDLQFVRINGTVVGALVGLGLHAITTLLA